MSWTVSFSDQLAEHFYDYTLLYVCGNEKTTKTASPLPKQHFAIIKELPRNYSCRIGIKPTAIDENVPINENLSMIIPFTTSKYEKCNIRL